jgi:hypothetical protein
MFRFLLPLMLAAMPLFSHAIEEPRFEVIRQIDAVELRQYAPDVVATQRQPVLARYNGPMTPWFMRRNQIWLALR